MFCPEATGKLWLARIANRTCLLRDCPVCTRHFRISKLAVELLYYLRLCRVPCAMEKQVGRYSVDIVIEQSVFSDKPVALELDGSYRHGTEASARRDEQKDALLVKQGYTVLRVKERKDAVQITRDGNRIFCPSSPAGQWDDRVIKYLLKLRTGEDREPDCRRDHWDIQRLYIQERRQNSLAARYPQLAREWSGRNPEKADAVFSGTGGKKWWICGKCGREFEASVANRVRQHSGCPFCARKRVTKETSLAATHPEIAREWDPEKNGDVGPEDVLAGPDVKFWWRCPKGHSYRMALSQRTGPVKSKCPICSGHRVIPETSLAAQNPLLARYYDRQVNPLPPEAVAPYSNREYAWRCEKGHTWRAVANTMQGRLPEHYCMFCYREQHPLPARRKPAGSRSPRHIDTLAQCSPELTAQWHPTKNLPRTPQATAVNSGIPVWWICAMGHEWRTTPQKRYSRGDGCPYCSGRKACAQNSLACLAPAVAGQWDYERNGSLTPEMVTSGSGKRVWWICEKGHRWMAPIADRTRGHQCPQCRDRSVKHGSLAQEHPELAAQWDTQRNEKTPDQYRSRSNQKVWWRCGQGHSWQATPDSRVVGSGCPFCYRERGKKRPADQNPGADAGQISRHEDNG